MEEIIFIILIFLSLFTIYVFYKLFEKNGLIYSAIILDLLAFVLSFKIASIFKTASSIGIVPLVASFTSLYLILTKKYEKDIKNIIVLTLFSNIALSIFLVIMNYLIPSITETISINIEGTFGYNYKLLLLYPLIICLSQYLAYKIFNLVNQIQNNIFLSVNISYIIISVLLTIIFYLIGYINIMSFRDSLYVGISTYIIGLIVTQINIAFIYIIIKRKVLK